MMCFRKEPNNVVCFKNQLFGYCLDPLLVSNSTRRKEWCSLSGSWNKQFFFLSGSSASGSSETNHSSFETNKLILQLILETNNVVSCFLFFYSTNNKVQEERRNKGSIQRHKDLFFVSKEGFVSKEELLVSRTALLFWAVLQKKSDSKNCLFQEPLKEEQDLFQKKKTTNNGFFNWFLKQTTLLVVSCWVRFRDSAILVRVLVCFFQED